MQRRFFLHQAQVWLCSGILGPFVSRPIAIALLLGLTAGHARADSVSCVGSGADLFAKFRANFLSDIRRPAPLAVQPVTTLLPTGDDARLVFRAPASQGQLAAQFRVFETDGSDLNSLWNQGERSVLSVNTAPEKLAEGFLPADSTVIRFMLPNDDARFRPLRYFLVLRCV